MTSDKPQDGADLLERAVRRVYQERVADDPPKPETKGEKGDDSQAA